MPPRQPRLRVHKARRHQISIEGPCDAVLNWADRTPDRLLSAIPNPSRGSAPKRWDGKEKKARSCCPSPRGLRNRSTPPEGDYWVMSIRSTAPASTTRPRFAKRYHRTTALQGRTPRSYASHPYGPRALVKGGRAGSGRRRPRRGRHHSAGRGSEVMIRTDLAMASSVWTPTSTSGEHRNPHEMRSRNRAAIIRSPANSSGVRPCRGRSKVRQPASPAPELLKLEEGARKRMTKTLVLRARSPPKRVTASPWASAAARVRSHHLNQIVEG